MPLMPPAAILPARTHVSTRSTYYLERFFVWEYEIYCGCYWQCYGFKASKLLSLAYPPQYGKLSSSEVRENEVNYLRQTKGSAIFRIYLYNLNVDNIFI